MLKDYERFGQALCFVIWNNWEGSESYFAIDRVWIFCFWLQFSSFLLLFKVNVAVLIISSFKMSRMTWLLLRSMARMISAWLCRTQAKYPGRGGPRLPHHLSGGLRRERFICRISHVWWCVVGSFGPPPFMHIFRGPFPYLCETGGDLRDSNW